MTQKIIPNIWFDGNAKEAVDFYVNAFSDSEIGTISYYPEEGLMDFQQSMAGKELVVEFTLSGYSFTAINAGPEFSVNPSISFMLNFDPSRDDNAREHLDELWNTLSDGGTVLMSLGEYPYSKRYGWIKDKYGVSWQLMLTNPAGEPRPFIIPSLMFGSTVVNLARDAVEYYTSVFSGSKIGTLAPYPQATGPAHEGALMFADYQLEHQWFAAMDSGVEQDYTFNEAVSLMVSCKDQAEIDYLWEKLSVLPDSEQCGWCKDAFGVSWQIVPENMGELMQKPGAYQNMMGMKKLVITDF